MTKETTTIRITKETSKEFMLFKIQTNAKSMDEVLKKAIKLLKEKLKEEKQNGCTRNN